jgi:RNA polymerase sigma-70 factor (ECF subfamily)
MNMRSDEPELRDLMLAGLDGNAAAHKALLTRLSANLRAYLKTHLARMGKGPADAEDLVQETLIALHTRRHTYDRSKPLTPWVYAIARYRLVDFLRRTRTSMTDVAIDEADQVPADDNPASVESGLDLDRTLPSFERKPLI